MRVGGSGVGVSGFGFRVPGFEFQVVSDVGQTFISWDSLGFSMAREFMASNRIWRRVEGLGLSVYGGFEGSGFTVQRLACSV